MITVRLPDGREIDVDAADPQAAAKAARTFMARERGQAEAKATKGAAGTAAAGLNTVYRAIPFADEASDALSAVALRATGREKTLGDAWTHARGFSGQQAADLEAAHPHIAGQLKGVGISAQMAPMLLSGGATAAPAISEAAPGLMATVGRMAAPFAKGAVTGGLVGYLNGLGSEGSLKERAKSGDTGAKVGAAVGVAVPALAAVAKPLVKAAGPVINATVRAANKATGGTLLNANQEATKRLVEALRTDGASPEQIRNLTNEWLRVGGTSPSMMDVVSQLPSGGTKTIGLLRGAAMKAGPGRGVAQTYSERVAADLQDNAIARTRQLTPETPASAEAHVASLEAQRGAQAKTNYGAFRDQPVQQIAPEAQAALADAPGLSAIRAARADALERMDDQAVAELDRLAKGDFAEPFSAGTLDKVQRAMGERAGKLSRAGNNTRASGSMLRKDLVDSQLDDVAGVPEARQAFAEHSAAIEAVPHGQTILNAAPDEFAAPLADAPDLVRQAAQVGGRQGLTDAIGRPTEGALGVLNRIATATNPTRNLEETYGEALSQDYQQSIRNMVRQARNAQSINPSTGSRTAMNLEDAGELPFVPKSKTEFIATIIDKLRNGLTMTDPEREALLRMGTAQANPEMAPNPEIEALRKFLAPYLSGPSAAVASQEAQR